MAFQLIFWAELQRPENCCHCPWTRFLFPVRLNTWPCKQKTYSSDSLPQCNYLASYRQSGIKYYIIISFANLKLYRISMSGRREWFEVLRFESRVKVELKKIKGKRKDVGEKSEQLKFEMKLQLWTRFLFSIPIVYMMTSVNRKLNFQIWVENLKIKIH